MPRPSYEPPSPPPYWSHCGHGTTPEDPIGCHGVHVPGHTACLAHLADADRDAYLAALAPGFDIDHRGTTFTDALLNDLLDALGDPATARPRIGSARFERATFQGHTRFESVIFQGDASFDLAVFQGKAWFGSAVFQGKAWFGSAIFQDQAGFRSATFERSAGFRSAVFECDAGFESAVFKGNAPFNSATFHGGTGFRSTMFQGHAGFRSAIFERGAWFNSATFQGDAWFWSATFQGSAEFESATFKHDASFESAIFRGDAGFGATFERDAGFGSATFQGSAGFGSTTFQGDAGFGSATFQGNVWFGSATFQGDASFEQAVFERLASLGPLICVGRVSFSGAVFSGPVTLSVAARRLECRRTRWSSTAEMRLRYATVDFSYAVFEYPLTITAEANPFLLPDGRPATEQALVGAPGATVRVASLRGVDAAHLVLADVDLSGCLFTGTVHLDQLRMEGACSFDKVPLRTHWRRWHPLQFTPRRTLAEEHHWRASQSTAGRSWNVAVFGAEHVGPAQLAPVYRALRKAFEDGKNEPGAADSYYGEMEMRRHDRTGTTRAERGLLHGYWLLSGYGLRASRAMGWLAAAMLVTIVLLMGFGLPKDSPKQEATGSVPLGGGKVTFEIDKADPQNPTGDRFTGERFDKALTVTLNSVVFRSSGQDLTTRGTYIEMFSRVTEPLLLGLAVLAVRNRVKR
ncbi:pentapeptide repeat-containing protein [Streptomyces albidochromogenes]|uniref:Pentapeptide repeat-containing protein n=1 Tax=Streptomyces albidochromogenes TaxID=329524 RepID=A0ABW6FTA7_9ACTN